MSNEYGFNTEGKKLQDEFWRTRAEAKTAYKKWKQEKELHGNDTRVTWFLTLYSKAFQAYTNANIALFEFEAEHDC